MKHLIENKETLPKQPWSTPELTELKPDLIRQQDDEILYHVLNSEEVFRLVSGTAPGRG